MENGDRNRCLKGSAGIQEDSGVHIGLAQGIFSAENSTEVFLSPHTNIWSWPNFFLVGFLWLRNVLFRDLQAVPISRIASGGVQRVGLGFLLIQPVVSLRQERKTEAAELFGEGTLCSARSETALRWNAICSRNRITDPNAQQLWCFPAPRVRAQAGKWWRSVVVPARRVSGKAPARWQPWMSEGLSPRQRPLFGIACALFSPQDHADSGLPHGPEELPHGRTDVHHAVRKLWVLCTSSFWRGDHLFSLLLSPAISFPSWNPFPAQPSLEACSRTSCLGFSIHSAHVTFAGEAKPQKIPCEEPWLACVYIGLSLRRREVKVLSAASGIFSLWMNICPLHMLPIPKEGKMMSFFQRKRSSWKK